MFRGVRFSLAWWAYNIPDDERSLATAVYVSVVTNVLTLALAVGLSGVASVTIAGVLVVRDFDPRPDRWRSAFLLVDGPPSRNAIKGRWRLRHKT